MKALVFDLDGTLVDTNTICLTLEIQFLKVKDGTKLKGFVGLQNSRWKSHITVWPRNEGLDFDDTLLKEYYELYLSNYDKVLDNKSVNYDGVVATLEKLQLMGVKLGLCTNKPEKHARAFETGGFN